MKLLEIVKNSIKNNKNIAMFIDMDGVVASLNVGLDYEKIKNNEQNFFFTKKPIKSVINDLASISKLNVKLYILSACLYNTQAKDKVKWLDKYMPFIKKENQMFLIKEESNYTKETKSKLKVEFIKKLEEKENFDLIIYLEDEYLMLSEAYKLFKDKLLAIHISNLLD